MQNTQYVIAIQGRKAVKVGYELQNNYCYTGLFHNKKRIGQIEVVLDSPELYNGIEQFWVDVTIPKKYNVETALNELAKIGFNGCPCIISKETDNGIFYETLEMCCMII